MANFRYFPEDRETSAIMLIETFDHAREGTDEFKFGPLSVEAVFRNGLGISGETDALQKILEGIPGVTGFQD